jgi:hypothetical protein
MPLISFEGSVPGLRVPGCFTGYRLRNWIFLGASGNETHTIASFWEAENFQIFTLGLDHAGTHLTKRIREEFLAYVPKGALGAMF